MTGRVSPGRRRRRGGLLGDDLEANVLEADFGLASGVELAGEETAPGAGRLVEVDTEVAVDVGADLGAVRHDFVEVPVVELDELLARLGPEQSAAILLVKLAPPARAHVGLVSLHLAVRQGGAPELDAAVPL